MLHYRAESSDPISVDDEEPPPQEDPQNTTISPAPRAKVPIKKYFLLFDVNGTLMHFAKGKISKKGMTPQVTRARPGLEEFLNWCLNGQFEIVFWSSVQERNLKPRIEFLVKSVPRLELTPFLQFGQSTCLVSKYRDPENPDRPYFLKSIRHLLLQSPELVSRGANEDNMLLIDDTPYKNIPNHPFSAFHPPQCTESTEKNLRGTKPYLTRVLQVLLYNLWMSGHRVQDFIKTNERFGMKRLFPGDSLYELLKERA